MQRIALLFCLLAVVVQATRVAHSSNAAPVAETEESDLWKASNTHKFIQLYDSVEFDEDEKREEIRKNKVERGLDPDQFDGIKLQKRPRNMAIRRLDYQYGNIERNFLFGLPDHVVKGYKDVEGDIFLTRTEREEKLKKWSKEHDIEQRYQEFVDKKIAYNKARDTYLMAYLSSLRAAIYNINNLRTMDMSKYFYNQVKTFYIDNSADDVRDTLKILFKTSKTPTPTRSRRHLKHHRHVPRISTLFE